MWDVQWSSSATLAKEMATAGEHRYEDSYFLKRDKASSDGSMHNEHGKSAKRSKVEVPPSSLNANDSLDEAVTKSGKEATNTTPKEEKASVIENSRIQCTIH